MKKMSIMLFVCLILGVIFSPSALVTKVHGETLLIGSGHPLSGAAAPWGIAIFRGLEVAVDEINAKGGLNIKGGNYILKIISYDTKAQADEALSIANKLVFSDGVKFIMGASIALTCRSMLSVTVPNNIFFNLSCWGKELLSPNYPLNFRNTATSYEVTEPYFAALKKAYPQAKTIAAISPNDTSGWDTAKADIAVAKKHGIESLAEEYYERDQLDFHATLTRILAKKPDILDLAASSLSTGGVILKQAYEMGYRGQKAWAPASNISVTMKICGPEALEGVYLATNWNFHSPKFTTPGLRKLISGYEKKYGEPWDGFGISCYVGSKIVFENMEKIQSIDPVEVAKAMVRNQPYNTVLGPVVYGNAEVYGSPSNILFPLVLAVVRNGKLENVSFSLHPDLAKVVGSNWKFPD